MSDDKTEAGQALFDSFRQSVPWDSLSAREQGEYAEAAARFLRWELTREPSEAMVKVGVEIALNASIGSDYRWTKYVADKHRAMSRARLQELGVKE